MTLGSVAQSVSKYVAFIIIKELICGIINDESLWHV